MSRFEYCARRGLLFIQFGGINYTQLPSFDCSWYHPSRSFTFVHRRLCENPLSSQLTTVEKLGCHPLLLYGVGVREYHSFAGHDPHHTLLV